ncbi:Cloroperoxidase [Ophiobolus disseminans]|uniref:Cloroperoxidase n=1 Tax=Ophiobolus disseminans TaxID=1469910 RepID=A0A6A6ZVB3_9PLEO|nr:Cloroperoxidase [Ophiobolus disseminans]
MKIWHILVALSSSFSPVNAFPTLDTRALNERSIQHLNEAFGTIQKLSKEQPSILDLTKPVKTTGKNAFQAPTGNDQRGPCPGLNALANHGYISRDGITSFVEVVTAINEVMGMGLELSLILGVMGTVWTGNPLSLDPGFSIGGTATGAGTDNILGNLLGLVGKPRGLQGSHNWIESDSSLTRDDVYVTGDAWTMNMTLFRDIYDRADEQGVISMDLIGEQAARRWEYSVAHNPNFFYGPVSGMVSRNAGYLFLGRLLSNHTQEHPSGILTQETFKKFFAVYEDAQGRLEYRKGHETFPGNWYRTPIEYGLVPLNVDLVGWVSKYPVLGSIGGNTGKVSSFSGLDLSNITGGVLNAKTLLEGNNLLCFVFQSLKIFLPNSLSSILSSIAGPINSVTDTLTAPLLSLSCPAWNDLIEGGEPLWDAIQQTFPGAKKAGSSL